MNIQASRMLSAIAYPASLGSTRSVVAAPVAVASSAASTSDTVTISQAAKDLLAQSQASISLSTVSLSSRAMDLIQKRNPYESATSSDSQQTQVRKVMDNLTTQHNNKQISTTQYQHDMAFYTRVANAMA